MQTTRTPYSISFMATVLLLLLFACHSTVANAAVALGATRVIYPANQKQVLLPVTNNDPASVYLIQSWIENAGDQKDTQFVITPPLFSMQGKKENTLRIINATNHQLPGDRESLFWVNVKAIPAMEKDQKNENTLQLAIISRIKMFYRPTNLAIVAKRLGPDVYQKFTEGRTQEQWLQHLYAKMLAKDPALPSYDELKKMGIYKRKDPNGHFVAYKAFRDDPEANPLKTPSGKIEIYSSRLAEIARTWELEKDEVISPLPVYASTFEGWDSPERRTFPLQLFGFHYKSRTHSTYGNIDVLKAACRQEVWINPIDAQKRGIANGDMVRVFNHRGEVRLPAKVTPRILPGVSAMGQGAWHEANMSGDKIDHGGCVNTLTTLRPSPLAKGNPQHTNLVEIEKI